MIAAYWRSQACPNKDEKFYRSGLPLPRAFIFPLQFRCCLRGKTWMGFHVSSRKFHVRRGRRYIRAVRHDRWSESRQSRDEGISGNTFAVPFAAGTAALIWAANPDLSAAKVKQILLDTAHSSPDPDVPRYVNALGAVRESLVRTGHDRIAMEIISPDDGDTVSRAAPACLYCPRPSTRTTVYPRLRATIQPFQRLDAADWSAIQLNGPTSEGPSRLRRSCARSHASGFNPSQNSPPGRTHTPPT